MSDDETESEDGPALSEQDTGGAKTVRRLALEWLAPEFRWLWWAVETYCAEPSPVAVYTGAPSHRGNRPCHRLWDARKMSRRAPVPGLPKNWYNPTWWTSLTPAEQRSLAPADPLPIPTLVRSQSTPSIRNLIGRAGSI